LENLTKKYRLFKACRDFSFIQVSNYREKILKIQELAALSPAEKKRQDLRLAELQLSKLALMQFSF
jgi:hypothetical protein